MDCDEPDRQFKKFTFLRYCVLGIIGFIRAWSIRRNGIDGQKYGHPNLERKMNEAWPPVGIFWAGIIFIQTEGVGLVIYMSGSAVLDNFTTFFIPHHNVQMRCDYIVAMALYSMALFTFLPNCMLAVRLQGPWYDSGGLVGKIKFFLLMACCTSFFFVLRLFIVYDLGWGPWMTAMFTPRAGLDTSVVVGIAVALPPCVDMVQSVLLVLASKKASEESSRQLSSSYKSMGDAQ